MSWRLRELPDGVAAGAARVSQRTHIPMTHIEKGFWVTGNRPSTGFAASPAFDPARAKPARSAFESIVLDQLLWPTATRPTLEDCCLAVHGHASLL